MKKPKWLSHPDWATFKHRYMSDDGEIRCIECGTTERLSGDHIRPRHDKGKDDVHNVQPLCVSCNSRKNKRPDGYWSKSNYFDRPMDTASLRVSQNDYVLQPIQQNPEFFSQPWGHFNGKLFTYVQIVGAGRLFGMFALPFALNQCINQVHPASPRVDRILIVTKDRALRHQITEELQHEPTKFGVVSEPPKVLEITTGDHLTQTGHVHDIGVMCPNMLWGEVDHDDRDMEVKWGPHINDVLRRYPIIFFDEMHYANRHISRFVSIARYNLVFGFTASPLDRNGVLLDDMVMMGQAYGYREAVINDQSMKGIF